MANETMVCFWGIYSALQGNDERIDSGEKRMNTRRNFVFWFGLVGVVFVAAGPVSGGVHFSIGLGTTIGCWHPHDAWCGDWHWHRYHHVGWPWYGYPHRPWCAPTVGFWLGHRPSVVVETPVVVRKKHVVVEHHVSDCPTSTVPKTNVASEAESRRQSELLRVLRIGDVQGRMQSARELAGYAGDARARSALERALLSDREARVRQTAAEALAAFGDAKALPALKQAQARDSVRDVRQAAYKAIIMIEGY